MSQCLKQSVENINESSCDNFDLAYEFLHHML